MAEGYLLDTVACSRLRRGDPALQRKLSSLSPDATLCTSVITVGELELGIKRAPPERRDRLRVEIEDLLEGLAEVLDVDRNIAKTYGDIVSQVHPGEHVGANDFWIEAVAVTHDLILLTADSDFARIPQLRKEPW